MKTAISTPDAIFRAAERVAKRKGLSRSELYSRAVEALVRAEDDREVTAQLDRMYGQQSSQLDAALAGLPARTVEPEES